MKKFIRIGVLFQFILFMGIVVYTLYQDNLGVSPIALSIYFFGCISWLTYDELKGIG